MCNLLYVHLRNRQDHAEKCTSEKCVKACGYQRLEQWLDAPVTASERRAEERRKKRLEMLLRGQIPV